MDKVKAHAKEQKQIYIHNDIDQAAFYFKERIEARASKRDRDGIGYDMMACLIFLAFAVEAKFNFVGYKLIKDWDERKPALDKVEIVLEHLKIDSDLKEWPYQVIGELKKFRDALAHGKPEEIDREVYIETTAKELQERGSLSAPYEDFLKEELVYQAYEDVEAIWKELLERSGLNITDTITQGGIEYRIIEEISDSG